eukprot:359990-Chlamydomonas_euryale.AAC.10
MNGLETQPTSNLSSAHHNKVCFCLCNRRQGIVVPYANAGVQAIVLCQREVPASTVAIWCIVAAAQQEQWITLPYFALRWATKHILPDSPSLVTSEAEQWRCTQGQWLTRHGIAS